MRTARTTFSKTGNGTVTLDLLDALELSEVLDYLYDWLTGASEHTQADLNRFGDNDNATTTLRQRLWAFTQLLVTGEAEDDDIYGDDHPHPDQQADQDRQW